MLPQGAIARFVDVLQPICSSMVEYMMCCSLYVVVWWNTWDAGHQRCATLQWRRASLRGQWQFAHYVISLFFIFLSFCRCITSLVIDYCSFFQIGKGGRIYENKRKLILESQAHIFCMQRLILESQAHIFLIQRLILSHKHTKTDTVLENKF